MKDAPGKTKSEFALFQLVPNMLTIAAICAGLSAIRFGVQGDFILSVKLIVAACVLDGLDGRLARLLDSDSEMGAELDSLADFVNFGVAPPMVVYFWALQDMRSAGWITVLIFSICCVLRLARFNVSNRAISCDERAPAAYFCGIPSPAGALLVMFPMYVSFAFADAPLLPGALICLYIIAIGLLMISRIPVWSFKATRVSRDNVKFLMVGVAFAGAAMLTYAWVTMMALCLAYITIVIWSLFSKPAELDQG